MNYKSRAIYALLFAFTAICVSFFAHNYRQNLLLDSAMLDHYKVLFRHIDTLDRIRTGDINSLNRLFEDSKYLLGTDKDHLIQTVTALKPDVEHTEEIQKVEKLVTTFTERYTDTNVNDFLKDPEHYRYIQEIRKFIEGNEAKYLAKKQLGWQYYVSTTIPLFASILSIVLALISLFRPKANHSNTAT